MDSKYLLAPLRLVSFLEGTFRSINANEIIDVVFSLLTVLLVQVVIPLTNYFSRAARAFSLVTIVGCILVDEYRV